MSMESLRGIFEAIMRPGGSEGWLTSARALEMAKLIIDTKPETVVEIGVFGARSLVAQGLALKMNGHGKIYGIDPWKLEPAIEGENEANRQWWTKNVNLHDIHKGAMELIWGLLLDDVTIVVRSTSQACSSLFTSIDILNIDGNHSETASCRDAELYVPKVRKGGFIWMDDCDWETTKKAQQIIEQSCETVRVSPDGHYKLYKKL